MEEILLTKLMPPEFGSWLLPRERLLQKIFNQKSSTRIVQITAPAGYGKTVLAQQLSFELDNPLVWIQLDRYDNDPAIFTRCLVKGLRNHWPGLGEKVLQVAVKGFTIGRNPRLIASLLINDLVRADAEPLLVFDDAHVLVEPSVQALLQELLENFPPGVFCVVAGRTSIPINLHRLFAAGKALYIGTEDLAFSRDEIAALLEKHFGPQPPGTVEEIEKYTGGWPVALELAEVLLPDKKSPDLQSMLDKAPSLYDYLAAEILEKQPPEYRKFLLESAVLETLTPEECDRLLERKDSAAILESLYKEHHLLIPISGTDKAYRLHQLFRSFLLQRLGEKRLDLQRRAGQQALLNGQSEKAVEYFLQAGIDAEAEMVLEETGRKVLSEGRWQTLARWMEELKDEQCHSNPWFLYYRAVVEVYRGRIYEAEQWAETAATMFAAKEVNAGLMECRLLQARIFRIRGHYRESLALLEQAVNQTEQAAGQRFDIILEKGYNLFLSGNLKGAESYLTEALKLTRQSGDMQAAVYLTEALGNICYQQGKHAKAMQLYQWCLRVSKEGSLPGYYIQDAIPYIFCDWGELDKAREFAERFLAIKERYGPVETLPSAYSTLAYVYFELGDYTKVEELIRNALEIHNQHGRERFFFLLNQMVLAWCRLARGHRTEARQLIDETLAEAEKQTDQVCSMLQMLGGTALALMGNLAEAGDILRQSETNLEAMNFRIRLCDAYKALAYVYHVSEDTAAFQKYARKFLHLGTRMNYICNRLQFTADLLEPILRFGLEQGVEVHYVQQMLSHLGSRSHKLLLELAEHPDPTVRERIIVPITNLADEGMVKTLKKLAQDRAPEVRQSALAFMPLKPGSAKYDFNLLPLKQTEGPQIEARTFGPMQLFIDGKEICSWRTRKSRELIGLLIHLGEPAGKERLKEELWPNIDPQKSNSLFGTTIYYLRRRLDQEGLTDLIRYHQDRYSINTGNCSIDSNNFEEMVTAGLHPEPLQELGIGLLGKAVRLYRGDYMNELEGYAWALPRQVRLKHLYIEALLALSRYYYSRKNYSRAQTYLLKLKEADALCEQAHRLLMRINANLGRPQTLIEEHRNFKLVLMEETGLPPSEETELLFQKLVNNK